MGFEEKNPAVRINTSHHVTMENRESLSLTGILEVESFDEARVQLTTALGDLQIRGQNLHIEKLNLESGELGMAGQIWALEYGEEEREREGLLRRLLRL